MINPMGLPGEIVLFTGASSGIGRETSILASRLGAKVTMIARNEERLQETQSQMEGIVHKAYSFDLNQLDQIENMVKQIVSEQGPVDGFAHCAGISPIRPLTLTKTDFLDSVMKINFYSFVELLRILGKRRYSNDRASLVAISSVAGRKGAKTQNAYAASKAAIEGIISSAAKELAERSIRVNATVFGMIRTNMYQSFLDAGGEDSSLVGQYLGIGETSDAAYAILFLLSDASKFITGTTLVADGGYLA